MLLLSLAGYLAAEAVQVVDGSWVDLVEALGAVGALILFLFGFHREWWVTGAIYRRRVEEVERYREALDNHRDRLETETVPLLVRAADALTRVVEVLERQERELDALSRDDRT